jgi:hypothetical protein
MTVAVPDNYWPITVSLQCMPFSQVQPLLFPSNCFQAPGYCCGLGLGLANLDGALGQLYRLWAMRIGVIWIDALAVDDVIHPDGQFHGALRIQV